MAIRDWNAGQLGVVLSALVVASIAVLTFANTIEDTFGFSEEFIGAVAVVLIPAAGLTIAWRWFASRPRPPRDV